MAESDPTRPKPTPDAGIDDLKADIEDTRAELGDTVNALTAKLDVKGRATHAAADAKDKLVDRTAETTGIIANKATDDRGRLKPAIPVGVLALAAVVAGVVIWRRRR